MIHNPFIFGSEVSGKNFWDREKERRDLKRDLTNGQRVVLYSKRRMGKTSLVKEVMRSLPETQFIKAYVDLYPTDSVASFIMRIGMAMSQAVTGPLDKVMMEIKSILRSFTPAMTIDDEGKPVLTVDFGRRTKTETLLEEVLDAFPAYCRKKGKRGIFVLDEFQQIATYDKDHKLEAVMRSHFQTHDNVSYVFLGSKKHLLMEIFSSPSRPFYHSSKMFPLTDIDKEILTDCVAENFKKTGIKISRSDAEHIVSTADGNVFYAQKLSHATWNLASEGNRNVDRGVIESAFKAVVTEGRDYFYSLCGLLTPHQLSALKVAAHLAEGDKIFSKAFLQDHNWQKDSLKQALDALEDKDLISREDGRYMVEDVFFRDWLVSNQ